MNEVNSECMNQVQKSSLELIFFLSNLEKETSETIRWLPLASTPSVTELTWLKREGEFT